MTPRSNRVSKKILDKIWKVGQTLRSENLVFRFSQTKTTSAPRISFIVPKVAGNAVARNKLRRLGYDVVQKHLPLLPKGLVGALIYTPKKQNEKSHEKNFSQINRLVPEIFKDFF